jgi:hypothetical protein
MPTFARAPYVARGRTCYRNVASGARLSSTSVPSSKNNWTMCGWFVRRGNNANFGNVLSLEDGAVGVTDLHDLTWHSDGVSLAISNGTIDTVFPSSPAQDQPFFAAYTVDNAGFLNAYWRAPASRSFITSSLAEGKVGAPTSFTIASFDYDSTLWSDMNVWNVKVWNRVLTARELMTESLLTAPNQRNLWAWYPLEGNATQLLKDRSGNSRHLTQNGTGRAERNPFPRKTLVHLPKRDAIAIVPQYARPNADTNAGWSAFGAPTTWQALDEVSPNDNDGTTTTVVFGSSNSFQVGLSSVTDPAVSTGHILRIRHSETQNGGLPSSFYTVSLWCNGTLITSRNLTDWGGGIVTEAFTLTGTEADAITNYGQLAVQVDVSSDGSDSLGFISNVYWTELEVPRAASPILVSVADTNSFDVKTTGAVATPSISWLAGDLILVVGETENNSNGGTASDNRLALPTASGLTFAQRSVSGTDTGTSVGDDSLVYAFTATAASNGSGVVTCNPSSVTALFAKGAVVYVYRSATLGAIATLDHSANKTISLTRTGIGSAVVVGMADWNAVNDTVVDPTPATTGAQLDVAHSTPSGAVTFFFEHWPDQGNTGTTSYGITNHTGTVNMSGLAIEIKVNAGSPPTISVQPQDQNALVGQTATFSITSPDAASYQWQKETAVASGAYSDIGGATSSSYTTPTLVGGDNFFRYRCKATNANGTTTSNTAYLRVDANAGMTKKGIFDEALSPKAWF